MLAPSYKYSAFGRTLAADAGTPAPIVDGVGFGQALRWQGRPWDSVTGSYDFRNRIWDPGLGAFLSPDEFVFHTATGTVWSWPGQNPVLYRDSTGRFWDQVLPRVTPANPTSFIGIVVGVVGGSGLPDVSLTSAGLVLEFHNNAIQSAAGQSTTYGHVIVYSRVGTATIATKRPHELAHVKQHAILGELYLPAHLLAGAYSLLTAGSWAKGNPLEAGPYSTPPCAF